MKRRGRRRWLVALGLVLTVLLVAGGTLVWIAPGRNVEAPVWMRQMVSERLDKAVPGSGLDFGEMRIGLVSGREATIALRDVALRGRGGLPLAEIGYVEARIDPLSLLVGRAGVSAFSLSEIGLAVRRDTDGRLALAFEEALEAGGAMPGVPQLVEALDRALVSPHLANLREATVDAVTLRYEDYRANRAWTVDGGRLTFGRSAEDNTVTLRGDFALLTGGSGVATMAVNAQSTVGQNDLTVGILVTDVPSQEIATQSAALAWLGTVRAPMSGAFRGEMFADGSLGPLNATLQAGQGVLQPDPGARPIPFDAARSYFSFEPERGRLVFDELSVEADWGDVSITGAMVLEDMQTGLPQGMSGQFQLSQLRLNPDGLFEVPFELQRAEIDMHLALDPFSLRLGRVWVDDPRMPLQASGALSADPTGWTVAVDGTMGEVQPDAVAAFWPPALRPGTRRWLVNRVETAKVRDGQFALRSAPTAPLRSFAEFAVEEAVIHFADRFPPLLARKGRVTIDDRRLTAVVTEGAIEGDGLGLIDVSGSRLHVPDIGAKPSQGRFDLTGSGEISPMLSILDRPPMRAMQRADLPVELATGRAEVSGWLAMPFKRGLKGSDFRWDIAATLSDVATSRLVPNRRLAARELELRATPGEIVMRGEAALDGVPMTGSWRQPLGRPGEPGVVLADVPVSAEAMSRLGIAFPADLINGAARGSLRIELGGQDRPTRFALTSDLEGLGARIDPLGYRFRQSDSGRLTVSGRLQQPIRVDAIEIAAGALSAEGRLTLRGDGGFDRLSFDRFQMGRWLSGRASIIGRGQAAPAIALQQGQVDLRRAPDGVSDTASGGGSGGATSGLGPVTLDLREFRLTDEIALTNVEGTFTTNGGLQGGFRGRLNGGPVVTGQAQSTRLGTGLTLQAPDAGKVLQAAGVLNNARGGALDIVMTPRGGGTYDGQLHIDNIRLRDSPGIAALLDAISIVGLIDQLTGPGIVFNEVDGEFRLTPERLILSKASAIGPSMGVSLDGYYTPKTGQLDFQGVLSPIYVLNAIGQIFTRKGEGLVGFSFTLRGTADKPRVRVNPLSLLTPGMFREIFRRPPPKLSN